MPQRPDVLRQAYLIAAVAAFLAAFLPTYADDGLNLWQALGTNGGASALLGLFLILLLAGFAVLAAVWTRHRAPTPVTLLLLSVVGLVMLRAKPGASDGEALGAGGELLMGVSVLLVVLTIVDLAVLTRHRNTDHRPRPRPGG